MKSPRLLRTIMYEPWMIMPEAAAGFMPVIAQWLNGEAVVFEEKSERLGFSIAGSAGFVSPGYAEDIASFEPGSIGIVNLKGEMTKYDGWCNYGTSSIGGLIRLMADSPNISGIVLDVDGPGGAVNAIPPMIQAIQYMQQKGKPVVAHGDLVASAHLYATVYADYFMLDSEMSRAGSVGTMIEFRDYTEMLERSGIKVHRVYAPESTHKNIDFEQALKGDYALMESNLLSPLAQQFQQAVRQQRGGKLNEGVDGILSGAMFFGRDAVKHGLADGIGTLGDAIQRAFDLVEIRKFMRIG